MSDDNRLPTDQVTETDAAGLPAAGAAETEPHEAELRRQLNDVDSRLHEAELNGATADVVEELNTRRAELQLIHNRRIM
jgi:hypothetical protein